MRKLTTLLGAIALASCQSSPTEGYPAPPAPTQAYVLPEPVVVVEPVYEESIGSTRYTVGAPSEPRTRTLNESLEPQDRQTTDTPVLTRSLNPTDILDQLYQATVVFTLGERHNIADTIHAHLAVGVDQTTEQLIEDIGADPSFVLSGDAQISKTVTAVLTAPGFDVTSASPMRQAVVDWDSTMWRWDLRPKHSGKLPVTVALIAHVRVDGEVIERSIKTFERTVVVEVTPLQRAENFIAKYWQWLVTTLLIPVGIVVWRAWKQRTTDRS